MEYLEVQILPGIISTVIGGVLLTAVLFFLNEYIFPLKNLTGKWELIAECESSTYNPYVGLSMHYKVHLLQSGRSISGSAEKIKEIRVDGEVVPYSKPMRVTVTGTIERKFLRHSVLALHTTEEGSLRQSTVLYQLKIKSENLIEGVFTSTAAESTGTAVLKRALLK